MKLPQNERVWIGGGVAVSVLLVAAGWFGMVSPELDHASQIRTNQESAQSQNIVLQSRTNQLRADSQNLAALTGQLTTMQAALPADSNLATLTLQLNKQAVANKVQVTGITVTDPTPVTATGGPTQAVAVGSVASPAGKLFAIKLTVTTTGPLSAQRAFLSAVQATGNRAVLVNGTKITPVSTSGVANSVDPGSAMSTDMSVFVAPLSPAAAAQLKQELSATIGS